MAPTSRLDNDAVRIVPVLLIFFVLLKAYVVSRYSLTTTGALVVAAPVSVLVGTVTAYFNVFLVLIGAGALWFLIRHRHEDRSNQPFHAIAFSLVTLSVLFFPLPVNIRSFTARLWDTFWYVLALTAAVELLWQIAKRMSRRNHAYISRFAARRPAWFVALFVIGLLIPTLRVPWVPAEVLVLREDVAIRDSHPDKSGELVTTRYPVVYVLSEDGPWLTVLDADTRILIRLPIDIVAHRQVCHHRQQPPGTVPLIARLAGFRYDSPNTMCHTLVEKHETLLDPLVVPEPATGG